MEKVDVVDMEVDLVDMVKMQMDMVDLVVEMYISGGEGSRKGQQTRITKGEQQCNILITLPLLCSKEP